MNMRLAPDVAAAIRKLTVIRSSTYRRDFREAAAEGIRVIQSLTQVLSGKEMTLRSMALLIEDRAEKRPQVVFRTIKAGVIRWQAADSPTVGRIKPEQIIGTYDRGADWRHILADLESV